MQLSPKIIKAGRCITLGKGTPIDTAIDWEEYGVIFADPEDENKESLAFQRQEFTRQLEREKERVLEEARLEAERAIVDAWQAGHEKGLAEGRQQGYQEGYESGMAAAREMAQSMEAEAKQKLEEAARSIDRFYQEKQEEIIDLACSMASQIVHERISVSDEKLLPLITPVLQQSIGKGEQFITVSVHPEHARHMKQNVKRLEEEYPNLHFAVFPDSGLEENGCTVESAHAITDLQIQKQLAAIAADLKEMGKGEADDA